MSDSHAEQLDPSKLGDVVDDEQQLVADTGDRDTSPEAAAIRVDENR